MTRDEATKILNSIHEEYVVWQAKHGASTIETMQALSLAIRALREQEQREQGCEFCREDSEGYYKMLGSFSISNPFHKGEHYLNGGKLKPRKINFCPMCGRKLGGAE